jgi:hypothetical protein
MSYRLAAARLWMRESVMLKELERVADLTTAVLDDMLEDYAPGVSESIRASDVPAEEGLEGHRRAMANGHRRRVTALVEALGHDRAVEEGRRRMFPAGERLGMEARQRLGLEDDLDDLVAAAKLIYKVLGIEVDDHEGEDGTVVLVIDRCALAEVYDPVTCMMMSAADEGMVRGLNPGVSMTFIERITEGRPQCKADLVVRSVRKGV